jgi:pimeloyl-ACP methyl ester carboxylesterase
LPLHDWENLVFPFPEGYPRARLRGGEHTDEIDREIELPDRGRITVRDIPGPAGAPVVMLLHGLGATARLNFGRCFRPLSAHFRVLAIDHRGHGRGLRTLRFRLEECADDAAAMAEALGVRRFVAVGYSMGGPIASLLWRRHPDRVRGLVLCATARHFVPRNVARLARVALPVAATAARWAPARAHHRLLQRMLLRVSHPELRERIRAELAGHEPASVIQAAEALTRFSSRDWIGAVDVPTAVVVTTLDELVPTVRQRKLAASIPGAELFEVKGDHDACIAHDDFAPTLVRACLSVAARANLYDAAAGR